ncbi:FGGY family carbohydrate kinase, partial [Staphylococcus epidermidis]|uniref:FGGY family carbohydrate kinase n=1 Tax=Staphylococcus epidermidis TaxID=1282 RepID=UPI0037DA2EDB
MHGLVVVDDNAVPLRKPILSNHTTNSIQSTQIQHIYPQTFNYNPILQPFTLPKILSLQQHQPQISNPLHLFIFPKHYLPYSLTHTIHIQYTHPSTTLLFNPHNYQSTTHLP